jgi:hypothetical protein
MGRMKHEASHHCGETITSHHITSHHTHKIVLAPSLQGKYTLKMIQLLLILSQVLPMVTALSYSTCDSNSIPASTKASKLVPNTFHKLCPGVASSSSTSTLKHPICGDGTPFSFFFARPTQRKMNSEKLRTSFT